MFTQRCILTFAEQDLLRSLLVRGINLRGRTIFGMAPSTITADDIADGSIIASKLTENSKGWITDIVFSATDYRIVAWTSGTIIFADGTSFAISAGNTGNMAALTYIYFNKNTSTTVLQVTTTYSNVTGEDNLLLCVAKNIADTSQKAFYIPAVGVFGLNELNIGVNSISTNLVQANAITAAKISVANLSAISADIGTITAGSLTAVTITASTITGSTIKTAASGGRIELDSTNGLRCYDSGGTLITQIPVSAGSVGVVYTTAVIGGLPSANSTLALFGGATPSEIEIQSTTIKFFINNSGTAMLTIKATEVSPVASNVVDLGTSSLKYKNGYFAGSINVTSGQGIATAASTGLAADDTNGTLIYHNSTQVAQFTTVTSRIGITSDDIGAVQPLLVVKNAIYCINATTNTNYAALDLSVGGSVVSVISGKTGSATAFPLRIVVKGHEQCRFDDTIDAASTVMQLVLNSSTYRVTVDNSDLGSGTKKYLYLA